MKFYLILFEIFSLVWIVSCKKNETTIPDNTICSTLLKLDTVWQVPLDTNFLLGSHDPVILNGQLMYNLSVGFEDWVEIRNSKTGEFINRILIDDFPIYYDSLNIYENKFIFTNSYGSRIIITDPISRKSEFYYIQDGVSNLRLRGKILFGSTFNLKDTTTSLFTFNIYTKKTRVFNTIKLKNTLYRDYLKNYYSNIKPFVTSYNDTLIAYTKHIEDNNGGSHATYGIYNLNTNLINFDKTLLSSNLWPPILVSNDKIFLRTGSYGFKSDINCVQPDTGKIVWTLNKTDIGLFRSFGNFIFTEDGAGGITAIDAISGKQSWTNPEFQVTGEGDKIEVLDNLLFISGYSTITIADINSGCIFRKIKTVSLKSNHTDFCLDKPNRLLYVFGSDYKLTCIKF